MKNIQIRKITDPSELNVLRNKHANYGELNFGFSADYLDKLKKALGNNTLQLVAENGSSFAGYVASISSKRWPNHLEILEIFVDPEFQGKGIGTGLVNEIVYFAEKEKMIGIVVQTEKDNLPAQMLYEKLGFIPIENPEWPDGITYNLKI
jgi:ribosomal protein S18 acetylase RimI-like enzyme